MEREIVRITLSWLLIVSSLKGAHLIEFEEAPHEVESPLGGAVIIQCKTKTQVNDCQWMFKSLDQLNNPPIVVSTFSAYGNGSRDCSVRFKTVHPDQEGLWICGARENVFETYTLAPPFKLIIEKPPPATTPPPPPPPPPSQRVVQFAEITQDLEVKLGMPMHLICKTVESVDECIWTWRANAKDNEPEIAVKKIEPFGDERLNCDIRFDHAILEQDGLWTCGAKHQDDDHFTTSSPIRVSILEAVEFVQLSQDIQKAIGEPVLLRCITNINVEMCQWSWHPLGNINDTGIIVRNFSSYGDFGRDCSVRLKSVDEHQEGFWTCQVKGFGDTEYKMAPPAKLTVLYPVKVKFLEQPVATRVARGEAVVLHCVTSSAMEDCSWTWQESNKPDTKPTFVKSFPPFGNYSRNCSVRFKNVLKEQEGMWGCTASGENTTLTADAVQLTVFEPVPTVFVQLSKDIQIPAGSTVLLRCSTATAVAECRWTYSSFNDTLGSGTVVKQFAPSNEGRDCSMRLPSVSATHEGMWMCSARNHDEMRYYSAPPARLTLLQPESVTVALWASHDNNVSLACRLSSPIRNSKCQWLQLPHYPLTENNHSSRFLVHHDRSSGVCTLSFTPEPRDLGQWACSFHVNTPEGVWELAAANLILLNTPTPGFTVSEENLGWLVGVLALLVVVLTASLVAISLCKWLSPSNEQRNSLGNTAQHGQEKKEPSRYTDSPTKIDFQFQTTLARNLPEPEVAVVPEPNLHQHIYERVDRFIAPRNSKGLYENVE